VAELFEQQPRESLKAFAAFRAYLDFGPKRSLVAVGQKCRKSVSLLQRWSRRFDWAGRVAAHGAYLATVERQAAEAAATANGQDWAARQAAHREEEWRLRGELITAGRKVLERFKDGSRGATLGDVARALELASKLGRMSSGLATATVEHTGEVDVKFRLEIEASIKKAYGHLVEVEGVSDQSPGLAPGGRVQGSGGAPVISDQSSVISEREPGGRVQGSGGAPLISDQLSLSGEQAAEGKEKV
jgi:hypothetical protein